MTGARVLVTGATGFVGRHVVPALLKGGHFVTLALRNESACPPEWQNHPKITPMLVGDLADAALQFAFADVRAVVHLAGLAGGPPDAEVQFRRANAVATQRLAKAARHSGVEVFIHLSSVMAVTRNASDAVIDDATLPEPDTAYGRSKREAELAVAETAGPMCLSVSLRAPMIIGADAKGNWARLQGFAASGLPMPFASIRHARSLIAVDFLARIIARLAGKAWPGSLSGNFGIASAEPMTLPEMVRELRLGMRLAPRLVPFPPAALRAIASVVGLRRPVASLTSALQLDPSRFFSTFEIPTGPSVREAIRQSGAAYLATRRGRVVPEAIA